MFLEEKTAARQNLLLYQVAIAILESVEGLYLFLSTPTIPVNSFVSGVH